MTDPQTQTPEQREAELRAAGWTLEGRSNDGLEYWLSPDGRLFADAYGAWCVMRQERDNAK